MKPLRRESITQIDDFYHDRLSLSCDISITPNLRIGTSLEVHWLRLYASTARGTGLILGGELRSRMMYGQKK